MKMKMKRKDFEQFNDEFSDFSLSSPAWKIRRLNAGLPPIIEEEEQPEIAVLRDESMIPDDFIAAGSSLRIEELPDSSSAYSSSSSSSSYCIIEDPPFLENQERSIVLFKPVNSSFLQSSPISVTVDSDIISGLKNGIFRDNRSSGRLKLMEEEDETMESKGNLAVVPWVPRPQIPAAVNMDVPESGAPELMEAEDNEGAAMDIEEESMNDAQQSSGYGGVGNGESIQQWQQQHCMYTQMHRQTSTPITWSR